MKALLLTDRPGDALAPLTDRMPPALLPVAGKPVVVHVVEALVAAGVREIVAVAGRFGRQVEGVLGDGSRWGARVDFMSAPAVPTRGASAERLLRCVGESPQRSLFNAEFLIVRGDVLFSPVVAEFLSKARDFPGQNVGATIGGVPIGLQLVRSGGRLPSVFPDDPGDDSTWRYDGPSVELDGDVHRLESLLGYHEANLDAVRGVVRQLRLDGQQFGARIYVDQGARVARGCIQGETIHVGARCEVLAGASLISDVVLGEGAIVDESATLVETVVMPGSYVGPLVELAQCIVYGSHLIRVDRGPAEITAVADELVLSEVRSRGIRASSGGRLSRAAGWALLVLSLPLWPVAMLASLVASPRRPLRLVRLLGSRPRLDDRSARILAEFAVGEWATRVPALRYLPRLLAVARGELRLVGVSPLAAGQPSSRSEDWEVLRGNAPVGLLGPAQLRVGSGAPQEQRSMMDSVYARTRSMREDLRWLVRGAALLFTARAWKPTLPRAEVRSACPQPSRVAGSKAEQGVGEPQEAELQTADS